MDLHAALLARLDADAKTLCARAVDHVFDQPLSTFLSVDRVEFWLEHAFDEGALAALVEAHAIGFIERERARAAARGDTLRDWISAEAQAELRALAAKPVRFERRTLERYLGDDAVVDILRSMVRETLDRFVDTFKPGGSGGGLIGAVGRGAFGLAGRASRGLLGGVGAQVEESLKAGVRTFADGSMSALVERFIVILMQPETSARLGRMRLVAYDRAMAASTAAMWDELATEQGAVDEVLETVAGLIAHNLERDGVRVIIREEVARFVELEGERSIRSLLPAGNVEALRDEIATLAAPLIRGFAASEGFAQWLAGDGSDEAAEGQETEEGTGV